LTSPAPDPRGPAGWGTSLWIARNPAPPATPRFSGALDTDIAIVGAGLAGVSLAFHLAAAGGEAVVLEAAARSCAATAASAGVVAPQLVRNTPASVIARLGHEPGGRFLRFLASSGRRLFDLVAGEAIACDAQPFGFLNPAPGPEGAERLGRLAAAWAPFRDDLVLADAAETRALTRCEGYGACLVDPTGGGIDPVAFIQGLTARLPAGRATVFYDSPVVSVTRRSSGWTVKTREGTLTARRVVLCANGGNARLHRTLARTILPLPVYQLATTPLPEALRRDILPRGHAMTDASADVFSLRFDGEGRLITAVSAVRPQGRAALERAVNQRLAAALPAWRPTPLAFGWKGVAWIDPTFLPRLTRVEEGLIAVQACNGRGLALNAAIGADLARWLMAPARDEPAVPMAQPRPIPGWLFARAMPGLMMAGAALSRQIRGAGAPLRGPTTP
jgi:glycine/D-amino acid oxidase-like deaminating enzyme